MALRIKGFQALTMAESLSSYTLYKIKISSPFNLLYPNIHEQILPTLFHTMSYSDWCENLLQDQSSFTKVIVMHATFDTPPSIFQGI